MNEITRDMEVLIKNSMSNIRGPKSLTSVIGMSNHYIGFSDTHDDRTYRLIMPIEVDGKTLHLYFKR